MASGNKMERHTEMRKENLKLKIIFVKMQEKKYFSIMDWKKNLILKFPKGLVFYALSCQSYGTPEKTKCERRKNIRRRNISMQKEWEKPDHKQRSYDNKDFHLRWSSSFFRRKIRHWLGVAFSSHNSKQFMSTFIFFLSSGKYNFFLL